MKFGFVILHYKNADDTIDCVNSIKDISGDNNIYIIDNYSNNGSFEKIQKIYSNDNDIKLIALDKNLGFSKGNNAGIVCAKKDGCQFIAVINNDTIIKQKNFTSLCINIWNETHCSIYGPRIISIADNCDQNPFIVPRHFIKTIKDAIRLYFLGMIKYISLLLRLPVWWDNCNGNKDFTGGLSNHRLNSENIDFLLYGAAFVLTPSYLNQFDKLCDLTFMYEEETIMYILSKALKYKMVYSPEVEVFHKEGKSTNLSFSSNKEKLLFGYREDFYSRGKVLYIMNHFNDKQFLRNLLLLNC